MRNYLILQNKRRYSLVNIMTLFNFKQINILYIEKSGWRVKIN